MKKLKIAFVSFPTLLLSYFISTQSVFADLLPTPSHYGYGPSNPLLRQSHFRHPAPETEKSFFDSLAGLLSNGYVILGASIFVLILLAFMLLYKIRKNDNN